MWKQSENHYFYFWTSSQETKSYFLCIRFSYKCKGIMCYRKHAFLSSHLKKKSKLLTLFSLIIYNLESREARHESYFKLKKMYLRSLFINIFYYYYFFGNFTFFQHFIFSFLSIFEYIVLLIRTVHVHM